MPVKFNEDGLQITKTDLFTFIHKALRSIIYNAGAKLQAADFSNKDESAAIVFLLKNDLQLLHEHAHHKDNIIFPEVKNQEPEMITVLENEHKGIEKQLHCIHKILDEINNENKAAKRPQLGIELNTLYNDFAAAYLAHMNREEATVLGAMKTNAPKPVFENLITAAEKIIEPARWEIIKERIGL